MHRGNTVFGTKALEIERQGEEEGRAGTILTPGVINADLVVVQSEATKELYINILTKRTNQKDRGYWEKRIVGAGSPKIEKVEVIRRGKVRRAKLTYLRGRIGKAAKVKEIVK